MATCWKHLQQQPDINLTVIAFQACTNTAFANDLMDGITHRLLSPEDRHSFPLIKQAILDAKPHIVVLCGWLHPPYRQLTTDPDFAQVKFVMGMDTPWQGTLKQHLAPLVLRRYLSQLDQVVVTGERSWQYACRLGIAPDRIQPGLYGIDYETWQPLLAQRLTEPWPKSFLFIGRYVAVKGIDLLVTAYQQYRTQVHDPWDLVCCGQGQLAPLLQNQIGILNQGFVQPTKLSSIWRHAGALILPSRFDPWPLVLLEAAAAGLPVICTQACGSAVEVIRHDYNGLNVPPEQPDALTRAMVTLHHRYSDLPTWGQRSQTLAKPYAASLWAQRWTRQLTAMVV